MSTLRAGDDRWTGDPATDRALLKARALAMTPSARNDYLIREQNHCNCPDRKSFGRFKRFYHFAWLDTH